MRVVPSILWETGHNVAQTALRRTTRFTVGGQLRTCSVSHF